MQLKVLSWNIWCGTYIEEVISFLKNENPDIVALQEVLEEEVGNTAATIAQALGYEYVSALDMQMPAKYLNNPLLDQNKKINYGNAVLSKHKIISHTIHELPQEKTTRPVVQADIKAGDNILHVLSLHLSHSHQQPLEIQNIQADSLIGFIPEDNSIIMGDFNCLSDSYPIQKISKLFRNTEPDGDTPTWCKYIGGCSVCKIAEIKYKLDYIFTTKDVDAHSFKVLESSGSDHLPVSVLVDLN